MVDLIMWFFIWLLGTAGVIVLLWFGNASSGMPYQLSVMGTVFIIAVSSCAGVTIFTTLTWEENAPWFFICGGSLVLVVLVVVVLIIRAYKHYARPTEQIQEQ